MIDQFDSRALRQTDCYGQRFMLKGNYPYHVLPAFGDCIGRERPFVINVIEKKGKEGMSQHNIVVRPATVGFSVDQTEITIETGDLVLWNCPQSSTTPYCIAGEKEFFSSGRMLHECGYTHIFGMAGDYCWRDAHGSDINGTVHVRDPRCKDASQFRRWREETLKKGTVVMIRGGKAKPQSVEIVTGQTVFFAIVKGPGISITDERLLRPEKVSAEKAKK